MNGHHHQPGMMEMFEKNHSLVLPSSLMWTFNPNRNLWGALIPGHYYILLIAQSDDLSDIDI